MRGAELQKLVEGSGLKLKVVCERTGYARSHLYKIMNKESVSVEELEAISRACHVRPGDLLKNSADDLRPFLPIAEAVKASGLTGSDVTDLVRTFVEQVPLLASWRRHEPVSISDVGIAASDLRNNVSEPSDGRGGAVGLVRPVAADTTHARAAQTKGRAPEDETTASQRGRKVRSAR